VREAAAAQKAAADRDRRKKDAAARARRERRGLAWRRHRLWQHGSGYRRRKEAIAAVVTIDLVALLLAYLLTSSLRAVLMVFLIVLVATPALAKLSSDRSRH
jgi:Flp pilus assembly protein TadB